MWARCWIVSGALAASALAGCGSSSNQASTASTATSSSTAALPPGAPPALRGVAGRVLVAGELSGLTPQGRRILGISAASWVVEDQVPAGQRAREAARLRRLGFVAAVREPLVGVNGSQGGGLSIVEQFRSPAAAQQQLAAEIKLSTAPGIHATLFTVPGIPGARGFELSGPAGAGSNVEFTKGSYYYLVGAAQPPNGPSARASVIAAAQHLYARVPA
jgi:hypothetical protein